MSGQDTVPRRNDSNNNAGNNGNSSGNNGNSSVNVPVDPKSSFLWYDKEEKFLRNLCKVSNELSETYMILYKDSHRKQTRLRLPAIVLSSLSGVASFGTASFPSALQKYVSIVVGLINVCIAMIQTYESYIKIADIVSRALTVSTSLKKLSDDIKCELSIPIENRQTNGITFLRDCFSRYQATVYQAPPLEFDENANNQKLILERIETKINRDTRSMRRNNQYIRTQSDDDDDLPDNFDNDVIIDIKSKSKGLKGVKGLKDLHDNDSKDESPMSPLSSYLTTTFMPKIKRLQRS